MYGPRILLRRLPLITEAITTVIHMTGIIMPVGITDTVGTQGGAGTGTIIPMVATKIEEITVGLTVPGVVGVAARLDLFPVSPGTRFRGKGPVFASLFLVPCDGGFLFPSGVLGRNAGLAPVWDLFRIIDQ